MGYMKTCPECLEETETLESYEGQDICPECVQHFQSDNEWNIHLFEESLKDA